MIGLDGKCVIVTGGGSGIGQATAMLLMDAGCTLVIADRNEAAARDTVEAIERAGGRARWIAVDVTEESQVVDMVELALDSFGGLYGAVNAAGVPPTSKLLHELELDELERTFAVNMRGVFLCMKHQIPAMLRGGSGSIVNIASMAALFGVPRSADYCGSKAAVMGLTRAAAADYVTSGIRVNAVMPGGTLTPMVEQVIASDPVMGKILASVHPMQRLAQPREIATCVRGLISEESTFVTGHGFPVDAGQGVLLMPPA